MGSNCPSFMGLKQFAMKEIFRKKRNSRIHKKEEERILLDGCRSRQTHGPGQSRASKDRSKSSHKALMNMQNNSSLNSTKAPKSIELNHLKAMRFEQLRGVKPKTSSQSNNSSSNPPTHKLWFLMPRSKSLTSMHKVQQDRRGTFNEYGLNLLRSKKQTTPQSAGKSRSSATVKKRTPVSSKPLHDCHNSLTASEQNPQTSNDRRKSSKCTLTRKNHAIESKIQTMKCSFDEVNRYVHSIKEERSVLMGILRDMILKNESKPVQSPK